MPKVLWWKFVALKTVSRIWGLPIYQFGDFFFYFRLPNDMKSWYWNERLVANDPPPPSSSLPLTPSNSPTFYGSYGLLIVGELWLWWESFGSTILIIQDLRAWISALNVEQFGINCDCLFIYLFIHGWPRDELAYWQCSLMVAFHHLVPRPLNSYSNSGSVNLHSIYYLWRHRERERWLNYIYTHTYIQTNTVVL